MLAMTVDDEAVREAAARKIFRRLRGAARLKQLADNPEPKTREEMELDRLRAYLREWRGCQNAGYGSQDVESFLGDYVKGSPEATELLAQSDGWAMAIIDASVADLTGIKPDGAMMRCALRVRWLNEGLSPDGKISIRVFRHQRLQGLSWEEADALADRAERLLVPIVKRRGLPL